MLSRLIETPPHKQLETISSSRLMQGRGCLQVKALAVKLKKSKFPVAVTFFAIAQMSYWSYTMRCSS